MKLNSVIYNKLVLQAKEADDIGLHKLGSAVLEAIGTEFREDNISIAKNEVANNAYKDFWKVAMQVLDYHNVESADIQKLNVVIADFVEEFFKKVENTVNIDSEYSELEPKLFGQK